MPSPPPRWSRLLQRYGGRLQRRHARSDEEAAQGGLRAEVEREVRNEMGTSGRDASADVHALSGSVARSVESLLPAESRLRFGSCRPAWKRRSGARVTGGDEGVVSRRSNSTRTNPWRRRVGRAHQLVPLTRCSVARRTLTGTARAFYGAARRWSSPRWRASLSTKSVTVDGRDVARSFHS